MKIDIQAHNFSLTDTLRDYVERRLRLAVTCSNQDGQQLIVRLSDVTGLTGGDCKRCHVQVAQPGMPVMVIEDTEAELYIAIDRAIDRAGRAVERRLADQSRHSPFVYLSCSTGHQLRSNR